MQNQTTSHVENLLNRVPEITIYFWVIKILGTTIGETMADFLNVNLNLGLIVTSIVTGIALIVALALQFRAKRYVPSIYWSAVVLISIFGTLVTDNLTDSLDVPLEISTIAFSIALATTFAWWYSKEKTLSIHSIVTARRESFYWLAILFTFALGTAVGDLMAEALGLGYATTGLIVAALILAISIAWRLGLNAILAFWLIYILTRPLGASLGDFLTQPEKYGGLGLGATVTSTIFLGAIIISVIYLSVTKKDVTKLEMIEREKQDTTSPRSVVWQVVASLCLLLVLSAGGYSWRQNTLQTEVAATSVKEASTVVSDENPPAAPKEQGSRSTASTPIQAAANATKTLPKTTQTPPTQTSHTESSPLGDLSSFRAITTDTLALVDQSKFKEAKTRITDLEYEWDNAESHLKPMNKAEWIKVDDAIDAALRQVRAVRPDVQKCRSSLEALLAVLK